jgi:hypothetical protein
MEKIGRSAILRGMKEKCGKGAAVAVAASLLLCLGGCDRMKEAVGHISRRWRGTEEKAGATDERRVLEKFGEPAEKLGLGTAIRTEHGVRYDRKWNYYYSAGGKGPVMRTVYFARGSFTGSVIKRPDGTWTREEVKFAF